MSREELIVLKSILLTEKDIFNHTSTKKNDIYINRIKDFNNSSKNNENIKIFSKRPYKKKIVGENNEY